MIKYIVTIEQPLCNSFEVEAENIEEALDIARDKYNNEEFVLTMDDYGTDAQIQIESEDGEDVTEWCNL